MAGTASNVTVTALDEYDNTATGYTGTINFTSTDPRAVLPANYTFVVGDAGVKTFTTGVTLKTGGEQSVTATDTVTATITGSQTGITVEEVPWQWWHYLLIALGALIVIGGIVRLLVLPKMGVPEGAEEFYEEEEF